MPSSVRDSQVPRASRTESERRVRASHRCSRDSPWRAQDVSALARGVKQEALLHLLAVPQSPPPGTGFAVAALEKTDLGGDLRALAAPVASPRLCGQPSLSPSRRRPQADLEEVICGRGGEQRAGRARRRAPTVRTGCGDPRRGRGRRAREETGSEGWGRGGHSGRSGGERDLTGRGQHAAGARNPALRAPCRAVRSAESASKP